MVREDDVTYRHNKQYFIVMTKQRTTRIKQDDILYFEKELRIIHVHTTEGISSFYGSFKRLNELIDHRFCRCHNSLIVNLNKITHLQRYELFLESGEVLCVSQRKYSYTREKFLSYMQENYSCII